MPIIATCPLLLNEYLCPKQLYGVENHFSELNGDIKTPYNHSNPSLCLVGASVIHGGYFEDPKDMKYWVDDVKCEGRESSISECPHRGWGVHNCGQGERAGVNCLSK